MEHVGDVKLASDVEVDNNIPAGIACCLDILILSPLGKVRLLWDLLSLLIVAYDIITLPLIAFAYDSMAIAEYMRIVTMLFWTTDILISFFTGYQTEDGYLEMRWFKVAKHYVRTHFPFDALVSSVDWFLFFGDQGSLAAFARLGKSARLTRAMRLFRMARLMRLSRIMEGLKSHVMSTALFSLINIVRLIMQIMVLNHFFACGWYAIAGLDDISRSWAADLEQQNVPMTARYLVAYQWSLSQFTPSSSEILPIDTRERAYALLMVFVGLVIYSSLLGNVTAIVNYARTDIFARLQHNQMLRAFFTEKKVSYALSHTILVFLKDNSGSRKRRVLEQDVKLLPDLPRHLREELHYEIYAPVMKHHAFFGMVDHHQRLSLVHICHSACAEKPLRKGEEPFHCSQSGKSMLFASVGTLDYFLGPGTGHHLFVNPVSIPEGAWITEAPLWIQWEHRGLLSAHEQSICVEITSERLRKVVVRQRLALAAFRGYAVFVAKEITQAALAGEDIDDLWGTPAGKSQHNLSNKEVLEEILQQAAASNVGSSSSVKLNHIPEETASKPLGTTLKMVKNML
jgi:hypothetical protein